MKLSDRLGDRIRFQEPLDRHCTFRIGGVADWYAEPLDRRELIDLYEFSGKQGIPAILIGKASNTLFPDEGFPGLVISLSRLEKGRVVFHDPYVVASAGTSLVTLAYLCADKGLGGIEFLGTIPGTVGGAVVMNAGFSRDPRQHHEVSDWLAEVRILRSDGRVRTIKRDEMEFDYRKSNLSGEVILEATFRLEPVDPSRARLELRANSEYRERVQDLRFPSAGSIFKNPKGFGMSAGRMIDQLGLKGKRVGDAQISEKHGNFIINRGKARARDVLELVEMAQTKVHDAFGVDLELEIKAVRQR